MTSVASIGFYSDCFASQSRVDLMLIRKNHYVVLPYGRFISGVCRWNFRFVTGECPPTQWYGGFTIVFDPGIHGVTTLHKGFGILRDRLKNQGINSRIDDFPMNLPVDYIQEAMKNNFFVKMRLNLQNPQIVDSQRPHSWAVGDDDVDHVVGSNNTSQVVSSKEVTMNISPGTSVRTDQTDRGTRNFRVSGQTELRRPNRTESIIWGVGFRVGSVR